MKTFKLSIILLLLVFSQISFSQITRYSENKTFKIAFGSCGHQNNKLPVFNRVVNSKPDFFIFLGDNIYGDTRNMNILKSKYNRLSRKKSFKNLKSNVKILATWDDHDYGSNDAGKEYKFKSESKNIFLDFFNEPDSSERRKHEGIYHSHIITFEEIKIQIILLDNRTFRDPLLPYRGEFKHDKRYDFYNKDYAPHIDEKTTILGENQWRWLESELNKPADIRIICSGTQFGIEWNGYEAWANFPHEQKKMLEIIKKTKAEGVFFITGDVHYSEISKLETDFYPIYDFTSSGLSSKWPFATPNKNRIKGPFSENHFGLIEIKNDSNSTILNYKTIDVSGQTRIEHEINLDELKFSTKN